MDCMAYLDFARPFYAERDPGHDFQHIKRIISRMDLISTGINEPINMELLYFLACFHGLVKALGQDEALREKTSHFLLSLGWDDNETESAFIALARHIDDPQSVEEAIIHDANFIELLGAFGVAKAFTTGGAQGQTYEETVATFEQEFLDKVRFKTPKGKELAEEGREYARAFLQRLRQEL